MMLACSAGCVFTFKRLIVVVLLVAYGQSQQSILQVNDGTDVQH